MKTIATINFKGGVGKTTVTWCLGDMLSSYLDKNVLLFDLDAQGSLTQAIEFAEQGYGFNNWIRGSVEKQKTTHAAFREFIKQGKKFNFVIDENFIYQITDKYHFVPATSDLYWVGLDSIDPEKGRVFVRRILEKIKNCSDFPDYDYVLFDCPPSFTPLSYSVLTCCDLVLIPINPDFFAAKGVDLLAEGLQNKIEAHPFPQVAVFANRVPTSWVNSGKAPTYEARARMRQVKESCREANQKPNTNICFFNTLLLNRVAIGKAISMRKTPKEHIDSFLNLWKECEAKLK